MDFLQDAKVTNVIPANVSIAEGALYVIENSEMEFNNIVKNIGLSELAYTEANGAVITNEASVKEVVENIIAWLKKKWESVRELFDRAIGILNKKVNEFKNSMQEKALGKMKEKAAKIKDTDKDGKKKIYGKTREYVQLSNALHKGGDLWEAIAKFNNDAHEILMGTYNIGNVNTSANVTGKMVTNQAERLISDLNDEVKKLVGNENSTFSESSLMSSMMEYLRGKEIEVDKAYINEHIETMFRFTTDKDGIVKGLKMTYNNVKKQYNDDIATLKKDKKNVESSTYLECAKAIKHCKNVGTSYIGALLSVTKEKLNTESRILMKLSVATVKESTVEEGTIESSSYQTELVSLFQW